MRLLARRNGRRILFSSDSRADLGGNLKLVYDRMVERGLDREFELLTLFKPGIVARRSIARPRSGCRGCWRAWTRSSSTTSSR